MSKLVKYRTLFSTRILHEYYFPQESSLYQGLSPGQKQEFLGKLHENYRISRDLIISPSRESQNILDNYQLIFKQNSLGFMVASQVSSAGNNFHIPYIPFDESFSLCFIVQLKNPYHFNFSNLPLGKKFENDQSLYYFSNRANNFSGPATRYLSQTIPGFSPNSSYEAGELFIDSGDPANPKMFEAIEAIAPGAFNNSHWRQIFDDMDPLPGFVSNVDRIALRPKIFNHKVASAVQESLSFLIRNQKGDHLKTIVFTTAEAGTPLTECKLELVDLPSAYYTLEVQDNMGTTIPGLSLAFYMDDEVDKHSPFALIEFFHEPDGSLAEYRWLDQNNNNALLSPEYLIRWKNRPTFWRYYYAKAPVFNSSDVEIYESTPGNPIDRILVSKVPLGLTQIGRRLEIDIGGDSFLLPNPGISSIHPEHGRVYSEINMGGGLGPPS